MEKKGKLKSITFNRTSWRKLWTTFRKKRKRDQKDHEKDKLSLFKEIEEAKRDWLNAGQKLDYVLEHDQIDYAIYALEAAERRYEMLLRKAKKMKVQADHSEIVVLSAPDQPVGQVLDR